MSLLSACEETEEITAEQLEVASQIADASHALHTELSFSWWLMAGSDDSPGVAQKVPPAERGANLVGWATQALGSCATVGITDTLVTLSLDACSVPGVGTVTGEISAYFVDLDADSDGMIVSSGLEGVVVGGHELRISNFLESSADSSTVFFGTSTEVLSGPAAGMRFREELVAQGTLRRSSEGCLHAIFSFLASVAGKSTLFSGSYARCPGGCPGDCDGRACVVSALHERVTFEGGATTGPPLAVGVQCGEK